MSKLKQRIITIPASSVATIAYNYFISEKESELFSKINILLKYNNWLKIYGNETETNCTSIIENENDQSIDEIFDIIETTLPTNTPKPEKTELKKKMICDSITDIINRSVSKSNEEDVKNEIKMFIESNKIKNNLKKELISTINKQRGIYKESGIVLENTNETKIIKNNKLYTKILLEFEHGYWINKVKIIGRVDGLEDNCLTEVKNRSYKIFDIIPKYEKIQIEMYFFLLEKIYKCKHIQCYNNNYKTIIYNHDSNLLESIKTKLISSLKDFLDFI